MGAATDAFFDELADRKHEPLLHGVQGTLRFDLTGADGPTHRSVRIDDGDVIVSHRRSKADCVIGADADLFERLILGKVNAVAAALRDEVDVEGDVALVLAFQRLFPGPPGSREPAVEAGGRS